MDAAWRDVTIEWLLCHRSGASQNFTQDIWDRMEQSGGTPRAQRRLFVEAGLAIAPTTPPNTETVYSNAGFMLAGAMLEQLADAAWEDLVRREVFEPLGMSRTGFGPPGAAGQRDQPLGHTRAAKGWSPIPPGPLADNPAAVGPAGSIHATLADWGRFVAAHLRGELGDESYLKRETWKRLHAPGGSDWSHSPGWSVSQAEWAGGALLGHLGSNTYWVSQVSMAPGRDVAFLIVTNVGDDAAEQPFEELLAALIVDHVAHGK
jgi:D-alanyl-D-alanine carboxypeptidase